MGKSAHTPDPEGSMPVPRVCRRSVPWALVCTTLALLHGQPTRQIPPYPRIAPLAAMAPAWSADDRTIAYMAWRDEPDALMAVPSTGGTPTAILADGHSY